MPEVPPRMEPDEVRAVFARTLARREKRRWLALKLVLAAGVLTVLGTSLSPWMAGKVLAVVAGITLAAMGILLQREALPCPACGEDSRISLDVYCPECRGPLAQRGRDWHCEGCERSLIPTASPKRAYRIRFCSHCGAALDDHGA